jgi:putative two-component system response regulator
MQVAIVDDARMNVAFMQHLVNKLPDCKPVCFTDSVEALDWCLGNDPDLLIVDYMMPKLSGIDLVRQFRVRHPDSPTLMVTANSDTALRHEALNSGVTDFLNKPVDNVEFLARAKNMLELRTSHKKLSDHAAWLADEVRKATETIVAHAQETIVCLAKAAEYRDPETGAHILRMSHYSRQIARCMGLSAEQQELLLTATPMHDIGKVATPDLILLKPGKLDDEEFAVMRQHAVIGYRVLSASSSPLLQAAADIAHTHHEKYDGTGYPRGLAGENIPLFGRIVAVADVFDALTSERPYKQAWSVDRARQMLVDGKGKHFDPACVDAFLSGWDEVLQIKERFQDEKIEVRDRTLD